MSDSIERYDEKFRLKIVEVLTIWWISFMTLGGALKKSPMISENLFIELIFGAAACVVIVIVSAKYCQLIGEIRRTLNIRKSFRIIIYLTAIFFHLFVFMAFDFGKQTKFSNSPLLVNMFLAVISAYVAKSWFDCLRDEI